MDAPTTTDVRDASARCTHAPHSSAGTVNDCSNKRRDNSKENELRLCPAFVFLEAAPEMAEPPDFLGVPSVLRKLDFF
jgi:hypothetical protein